MTKVCSKCPEKGEQDISKFQKFTRRRYGKETICYTPDCKECRNTKMRKGSQMYETHKQRVYNWRRNNRRVVADWAKQWAQNHPKAIKKRQRKMYERYKEELPDWYIAVRIADKSEGMIGRYEVTKEMIEIKRKQIKLIRDVKEEISM